MTTRDNIKNSFDIVKSKNEVRITLLTNTIKMLTARNILNITDIEMNISKIIKNVRTHNRFELKSIGYHIYIADYKLTSISKLTDISDFLKSTHGDSRIIIVDVISSKTAEHVVNNFPKTEIFTKDELMLNLIEHELQPKIELLASDDSDKMLDEYCIKKDKLPVMSYSDPVRRYFNAKRGDIFRMDGGFQIRYRVVE